VEERLAQLESRVATLEGSMRELLERLGSLEAHGPPAAAVPAAAAPEAEPPEAAAAEVVTETAVAETAPADTTTGDTTAGDTAVTDLATILSLIGRTLIGLAGGYLLRMLTSGGQLPEMAGVAAALGYAVLWLVLADRDGARGRRASAAFHGATATLLAIPLIWETTTRFELLPPAAGAAVLAAFTAFGVTVAWRRELRSVAWLVSVGAGFAGLFLGGHTDHPAPFTGFLVALGIATLAASSHRGWGALPWLTAFLADVSVLLLLTFEDPVEEGLATAGAVLLVHLALGALYAGAFAFLAASEGRALPLLAWPQTAAALAVGWAGAVPAARHLPGAVTTLAAAAVVAAGGAYFYGLLKLPRERRRDVLFLTSLLGAPLLLLGSGLLLPRPALFWALLALAGAWLGYRAERLTPSLHGAVYALAAVADSGLLGAATWALGAAADAPWPPLTAGELLALAAIIACLAFPVRADFAFWRRFSALPRLVLLLLAVWGTGGVLVRLAVPLIAGEPGSGADPAIVAAVRTAVLAAAAMLLAWAGRSSRLREASWLVYPVLLLGAVKLLVEDFPAGRASTLFVALALYGTALILAPRLGARRRSVDSGR
jgi:hypothetical protein